MPKYMNNPQDSDVEEKNGFTNMNVKFIRA